MEGESPTLRSFVEVSMSCKENKDVPSPNNLHLILISFGKSLIYIQNDKGPKMDPSGKPA